MPYYTLKIMKDLRHLHASARDRADALRKFGDELKVSLTLDEQEQIAAYLMDEWFETDESPHWTNPTIPVFALKP
jgi:hypothetical protein